jgi:Spy/CpxP family protein refolding chaperone
MEQINQNKFVKWVIIVLLAVNIVTVSIIWIQSVQKKEPIPTDALPPQRTVELMQNAIGLTDEQTKQFAIMREEHFAKRRMVETQIPSLNRQIFEEMFSEKKDTEKINSLLSQIAEKSAEIEKLRIEHFTQLAEICSREQKAKLKRLLINTIDRPGPKERRGNSPPPLHGRKRVLPPEQE